MAISGETGDATLADGQAVGTILDDDAPPVLNLQGGGDPEDDGTP